MDLVGDKWVERLKMETLILKTLNSEGDSSPSHASGEGTAEVCSYVPPQTQWLGVVGSTKSCSCLIEFMN